MAAASTPPEPPTVLFLCVHNAGRSQMAAGWLARLAGDRVRVMTGGSEPADEINPAVVGAMAELGIDLSGQFPKPWTDEALRAADVVVTMGCGEACPVFPGKRYEDWELADPSGRDLAAVRAIRDEIGRRVRALLATLGIEPLADWAPEPPATTPGRRAAEAGPLPRRGAQPGRAGSS